MHPKDQVSPICKEVDLRFAFHGVVCRAQYIDTLSWFNTVFAYRDNGSCPYTVNFVSFPDTSKAIKVFQIQIQSKNYIAKYYANTKTKSGLNPNSRHCY